MQLVAAVIPLQGKRWRARPLTRLH